MAVDPAKRWACPIGAARTRKFHKFLNSIVACIRLVGAFTEYREALFSPCSPQDHLKPFRPCLKEVPGTRWLWPGHGTSYRCL